MGLPKLMIWVLAAARPHIATKRPQTIDARLSMLPAYPFPAALRNAARILSNRVSIASVLWVMGGSNPKQQLSVRVCGAVPKRTRAHIQQGTPPEAALHPGGGRQ